MSFKDFDELVARTPKALPIGGVWYAFPDRVSAETGKLMLALTRASAPGMSEGDLLAATGLTPEQIGQITDDLLGDTLDEMISAGHGAAVSRVVQALTAWHLYGQEAAERAWNGLGPTAAPNRTARRASKATGTSTKRPASTAGTTAAPPPPAAA